LIEKRPFVVAGKVMVRNAFGQYLFLKRSATSKHFPGQWEMPGGKMDPGETMEACLLRETQEEAGVTVRLTRVLGADEGVIAKYRLAYIIFEGVTDDDAVTLSSEHDDYTWATPAEAEKLDLIPGIVTFVRTFSK